MVGIIKKPMEIKEVLDTCGGFVRYFGTNEPMENMVAFIDRKTPRRILACCGGGDQALTFLGHGKKGTEVFAFDQNPAQLFVLACKALYLESPKIKEFNPSFDIISRLHLGRIRPLPRHVQKIRKLVSLNGKNDVELGADFMDRFGFEIDSGLYHFSKDAVFWAQDKKFIAALRANLRNLRFIHSDVLFISDWFRREYLDVIYLSDIPLQNAIPYYLERLGALISCLKPGGLVIGNTEDLNELDRNPTIIEILKNYMNLFGLKQVGERRKALCLEKVICP